jgi:membrane peptidoglycan carboxypeptidase
MSIPQADGSLYVPQNYDLHFHGSVSLRHALDNSLNIPALKVILFAGLHDTIQTAKDLGITTLGEDSRYGPSLVLGGGEVRPLDMATAYATFANGGTKVPARAILVVKDRLGTDITRSSGSAPTPALDPRIAYMITNILSDDNSRAPEFGLGSPLKLSRPAAAKTGTTNDFRDNWTVGYTPDLATAVWVGNNDHSQMQNVDGITGAAPIWHEYMEQALAGTPIQNFVAPAGITLAAICPDGALADGWNSGQFEVFLSTALPTKHCRAPEPTPTMLPNPQNPLETPNPLLIRNLRDTLIRSLPATP